MIPQDTCVLIPGYNEAKNIGRVVTAVRALGFPVLVVDDGSKDTMASEATKAGAQILSYTPNQGKGVALRRGIEWFLKETSANAAIFMDSDGQHDPADLSLFLKALEDSTAGFIAGNRMANPHGMPWIRALTNRSMSALLSMICGQRVPDTQCGYRAATRRTLERMQLHTTRFEIESEMVLEAARIRARIVSVPVRSVYEGGTSHIRPGRDTARFFKFLFTYLLRKKS